MSASLLQRQVTQFDTARTQASIATPTCSSCCCCCCCLGASVAATVALPIDIDQVTPKKTPSALKTQAKIIAGSAVPATILFWVIAFSFFQGLSNNLLALSFISIAVLSIPLLVITFLAYRTASTPKSGVRALAATAIIASTIAAEAFIGMMLILSGVPYIYLIGAIIFAIAVPATMINKKNGKRKKSKKDTSNYDTW